MKKIFCILALTFAAAAGASAQPEFVSVIAHRGCWNCPEGGYSHNSIASAKAAIAGGFFGSEFDVNMTADGKLLVYHDGRIGGKRIEKHPASEFADFRLPNGEKIPTLEEYIAVFKPSNCLMVLEIKKHSSASAEDECVRLCIDELRRADMLDPGRVMFISFSLNVCRTLLRELPEGFKVQYLKGSRSPEKLSAMGLTGIDLHFLHYSLLHPCFCARAEALDMDRNAWTVNSRRVIGRMLDRRVFQLTTNEPYLARKVAEEKEMVEVVSRFYIFKDDLKFKVTL